MISTFFRNATVKTFNAECRFVCTQYQSIREKCSSFNVNNVQFEFVCPQRKFNGRMLPNDKISLKKIHDELSNAFDNDKRGMEQCFSCKDMNKRLMHELINAQILTNKTHDIVTRRTIWKNFERNNNMKHNSLLDFFSECIKYPSVEYDGYNVTINEEEITRYILVKSAKGEIQTNKIWLDEQDGYLSHSKISDYVRSYFTDENEKYRQYKKAIWIDCLEKRFIENRYRLITVEQTHEETISSSYLIYYNKKLHSANVGQVMEYIEEIFKKYSIKKYSFEERQISSWPIKEKLIARVIFED